MAGTSLRGSKAAIYPASWMADNPSHSHLIDFPEALEALFSRMGELKVVLGPAAAPGVDEVERHLRAGLAARERGAPGANRSTSLSRMRSVVSARKSAKSGRSVSMRSRNAPTSSCTICRGGADLVST